MAFSEFTWELCILGYPRLCSVGKVFRMCSFSADVEPTVQSLCVPQSSVSRVKETVHNASERGRVF